MKKATIILLIIMIASFTAAIILVGMQLQHLDELKSITVFVHEIREIKLSEKLKNITLESNIVKQVNIYSAEEDKIRIELDGEYISLVNKTIELSLVERPDTLRILVEEKGIQRYLSVIIYDTDLTLNVYIPAGYNKELNINVDYENIYIEDSIQDSLTIKGIIELNKDELE